MLSPARRARTRAQDGKALYTTVREFVENSLDAAESIGQLPAVDVTMCASAAAAHDAHPRRRLPDARAPPQRAAARR